MYFESHYSFIWINKLHAWSLRNTFFFKDENLNMSSRPPWFFYKHRALLIIRIIERNKYVNPIIFMMILIKNRSFRIEYCNPQVGYLSEIETNRLFWVRVRFGSTYNRKTCSGSVYFRKRYFNPRNNVPSRLDFHTTTVNTRLFDSSSTNHLLWSALGTDYYIFVDIFSLTFNRDSKRTDAVRFEFDSVRHEFKKVGSVSGTRMSTSAKDTKISKIQIQKLIFLQRSRDWIEEIPRQLLISERRMHP